MPRRQASGPPVLGYAMLICGNVLLLCLSGVQVASGDANYNRRTLQQDGSAPARAAAAAAPPSHGSSSGFVTTILVTTGVVLLAIASLALVVWNFTRIINQHQTAQPHAPPAALQPQLSMEKPVPDSVKIVVMPDGTVVMGTEVAEQPRLTFCSPSQRSSCFSTPKTSERGPAHALGVVSPSRLSLSRRPSATATDLATAAQALQSPVSSPIRSPVNGPIKSPVNSMVKSPRSPATEEKY